MPAMFYASMYSVNSQICRRQLQEVQFDFVSAVFPAADLAQMG